MLDFFQEQWDNFFTLFFSHWVLSQKEIRFILDKHLIKNPGFSIQTSTGDPEIYHAHYREFLKIPIAPFSSDQKTNTALMRSMLSTVISCYELLKDDLNNKGKWDEFVKLPNEIKLLKYLRDACAHNNTFSFRDKRFLPIVWKNKVLDEKLEGTKLFCTWMSYGDVFYLLNDITNIVRNL